MSSIPPKYKELKELGYIRFDYSKQLKEELYQCFCFYGSKFCKTTTLYYARYGFLLPTIRIMAILQYFKDNQSQIDSMLEASYQATFDAYSLIAIHTKNFLHIEPAFIKLTDKQRITLSEKVINTAYKYLK
jgi:hypothetical protein